MKVDLSVKKGVRYDGHDSLSRSRMDRFVKLWKVQTDHLSDDFQSSIIAKWKQGNLALLLPEEVVKAV